MALRTFTVDVVDLNPGSPYEAMCFSDGGIHADVRMCKIVACGWGALMDEVVVSSFWERPISSDLAHERQIAATAVTQRARLSLKCLGFPPREIYN